MEYTIRGSKNNVYNITYDDDKEYYECSCPDFKYRCSKNNEMCKHIFQVKMMDDFNVNDVEYTKRGITKEILNESNPIGNSFENMNIEDSTTSSTDLRRFNSPGLRLRLNSTLPAH